MRTGWLPVALIILLGAASPLWAEPFTEVPSGHWAYSACIRLARFGLLQGTPEGTFSGRPPITRFEFGIALLDPLTVLQSAMETLPPEADRGTIIRTALPRLRIDARRSEEEVARAFRDLRRLTTEFSDILRSTGLEVERLAGPLRALSDENALRDWRLQQLKQPQGSSALRDTPPDPRVPPDILHLSFARGTVGFSMTSPEHPPELLDYLAVYSAAERTLTLGPVSNVDPTLTDPRISRLRTSYEYGLGSALTLSLAYEEIARRGIGPAAIDAATLTSLGIGYQLSPSTSLKLSYSLLEYSNYALETPTIRDRVAETAVSIQF